MDLLQKNGGDEIAFSSSLEDQFFLLNFIMGTYLGPDITNDNLRRSAVQRLAESSPSYVSCDLGPSYISVAMLENLYYYVLRKAHPSLCLKPNMFHEYLKGSLHLPAPKPAEETRQFTSLFPLDLHKQIWHPSSFRVVKGIVLVDDPSTSHVEEKDLEKFRSLSRVGSFKIDMNELVSFEHEHQIGLGGALNGTDNGKDILVGNKRTREVVDVAKDCSDEGGPATVSLLSIPDLEKCISESEVLIAVSGTAGKGKAGPAVGVVDVGFSKVAYYFRVALPGVRKDFCKFSCEIESDGKVHVRGLTTGGKTIEKPSRVFKMRFQQLCPPGPFTLSFSLPGPVDPRLFAPNFRSDGIFEGVVIKHTESGT